MNFLKKNWWLLFLVPLMMAATLDTRDQSRKFPVARYEFVAQTLTYNQTSASTDTLYDLNGTIYAIEVITTDTEDNITYTVALANEDSAALFSEASMTDNTVHWRDAISLKSTRDADFNPIPVCENITVTITPSAAPDNGNVGTKTATVTVKLYMR